MGSLTGCFSKAGEFLHADDKAAIIERSRALRGEGKSRQESAMQAVEEQLNSVRGMLQQKGTAEQPSRASVAEPVAQSKDGTKPLFDIQRSDRKPQPFYSALARGIDAVKASAAPPSGWKDAIKGLVNKGTAKADEVQWSGVNEWLDLQQGKVTKQQVADYLAGNGVQVHDTVLGGGQEFSYSGNEWQSAINRAEAAGDFTLAERIGRAWDGINEDTDSTEGQPKYGNYQLPGGTNYREVLLTLPTKKRLLNLQEVNDARRKVSSLLQTLDEGQYNALLSKGEIASIDANPSGATFKSGHWDLPNVLAHIRLNDRIDADGKRVLFVEEIQSDWGAQGKKDGFAPSAVQRAKIEAIGKELEAAGGFGRASPELQARAKEAGAALGNSTPTAPFVTKTDAWVALSIKRVIKMAVDEGYDRVAFVNGEQSAERYDLSRQIGKVIWRDASSKRKSDLDMGAPEGRGTLLAYKPDGTLAFDKDVAHGDLPELIGKEAAKRLLEAPTSAIDGGNYGHFRMRKLEGIDLKVGGEGMRAFYDQIVPSVAKDVVRKLGGNGLTTAAMVTDKEGWHITPPSQTVSGRWMVKSSDPNSKGMQFDTEAEARAALSEKQGSSQQVAFDVTDAMREKAAGGVPLFDVKREGDRTTTNGLRTASQGYERAEVPRIQAAAEIRRLLAQHEAGKISDDVFPLRLKTFAEQLAQVSAVKSTNRIFAERQRGADIVRERLLIGKRSGAIDPDTAEFALWALDKNPQLADGLGISLRAATQGGAAGQYNPAARIMTLFKGADNQGTAVHEILHHTERMMPSEIQDGIRKEWSNSYEAALKQAQKEGNQPRVKALLDLADAMTGKDQGAQDRVAKAFKDGTLDSGKDYQLVNPSEFWAVRATDIMSRRWSADTWQGKAVQWMREMFEHVKGLVGIRSDSPVLKGLRAVIDGDGVEQSKQMLMDGRELADRLEVTKTPAFRKWFGESKVVDAQGKPLVVYHGTDADITQFDNSKLGFATGAKSAASGHFFTDDPKVAASYAHYAATDAKVQQALARSDHLEKKAQRTGKQVDWDALAAAVDQYEALDKEVNEQSLRGQNVMASYLSLKHPVEFDAQGKNFSDIAQQINEVIRQARISGADGVILHNLDDAAGLTDKVAEHYVVFNPKQIKSATGNRGTFDPNEPNILRDIARPADREDKPSIRIPGANMLDNATTHLSSLIDHGLNDSGLYGIVAPMSAGTQRTRAIAQAHINAERVARYQWGLMEEAITKDFVPESRTKMWNAADEQNTLMERGEDTTGKGLDRLKPNEREVVETLHAYSVELWSRAKEVGLVKGEGVNFWAPRMMAMIDESGNFSRPSDPGQKATSSGEGRNITTSASSAKERKYETSEETEAAMKAKGGVLVRDIRTMPLAMMSFERAIAGRQLINQIKDLGKLTGKQTVSESAEPGFFTLDHPAFMTYKPRMVEKDGAMTPLLDENGKVVMDKTPLYISKEFEGPLKAIMSNTDGKIYSGYMLLKSKAMSSIMFSPLIHNMVIAGRAFAYAGVKLPGLYFSGHIARADPEMMRLAIGHGMVPIGGSNHTMMDVGDIARGIGKEGGWGDPNESWIGLGAKKLGNAVSDGAGDKIKSGVDKAGDFWHGTLLWNRVGDLQAGIFKDAYGKAMAKGADENGAATYAASVANRYAGAVGRENMSEMARKWANVLLFSRSFNMGNIGAVKDVFYGMPAGMKAQLFEGSSPEKAMLVMGMAKRKAFTGLLLDLAATVLLTSAVQDWVKRNKDDPMAKQIGDALFGYGHRAADAWENLKANPTKLGSYDPYHLSSTGHNEPGKEDRVDMGAQPNGRHEYMRLPTGKVIEDTLGWLSHPGDTFAKKMSPTAKSVAEVTMNSKGGFNTPVFDPDENLARKAMDIALHLVKAQVPADTIQTAYDLMKGKATPLDKAKLEGNMTGLSISQGHPGGPEAAVAAKVEERIIASKKYVMEDVKRDLKYGEANKAAERLQAIGMTPKEAWRTIQQLETPRPGITKQAAKKFGNHATEEDRARMDTVGR